MSASYRSNPRAENGFQASLPASSMRLGTCVYSAKAVRKCLVTAQFASVTSKNKSWRWVASGTSLSPSNTSSNCSLTAVVHDRPYFHFADKDTEFERSHDAFKTWTQNSSMLFSLTDGTHCPPLLASRRASDSILRWSMAEVMLCDFWVWVMQSQATSAFFTGMPWPRRHNLSPCVCLSNRTHTNKTPQLHATL